MSQGINKITAEFIELQLTQQKKKPRGRRYNMNIRALGIALFERSPSQYRIFNSIFAMPQQQTVKNVNQLNFFYTY